MERYRIIETKVPVLSQNIQGIANFVPEIEYESTYHVQELVIEKFLWMTFKRWYAVQFYRVYGSTEGTRFKSIEVAKKHIEFREKKIERKVVCKE
jgi:hypothetical protein